jgi:hypothetical protein
MYRRVATSEHVFSKVFAVRRSTDRHVSQSSDARARFLEGFAACRNTTWAPNSRPDLERTRIPRELTWAGAF